MKNVMALLIFLLTTTVACTGAQKSLETGVLDPNPPPLAEQIAEAMLMNDHNDGLNYSAESAGLHPTDETSKRGGGMGSNF